MAPVTLWSQPGELAQRGRRPAGGHPRDKSTSSGSTAGLPSSPKNCRASGGYPADPDVTHLQLQALELYCPTAENHDRAEQQGNYTSRKALLRAGAVGPRSS